MKEMNSGKNTKMQNKLINFRDFLKKDSEKQVSPGREDNPYNKDCPLCEGTGRRLVEKDGHSFAVSCQCRDKVILKRRLKKSNIPEEYWGLSDDRISESVKALAIIGNKKKKININKFIKKYTEDFKNNLFDKKNILLIGANGAGKTFTSCKIGVKALKEDYSVKYVTSKNLIRLCGMTWDSDNKRKEFENLRQTDFLILDEYGKEYRSDNSWVYTELEDFLNYRFSQKKVTIIATNFPDILTNKEKESTMEIHQQSIISRLKGMTMTIKLGIKEDYRLQIAEDMWADIDIEEIEE